MSNKLGGLQGTAYTGTNANQPPNFTFNNRDPNQYDIYSYSIGDMWWNSTNLFVWMLISLKGNSTSRGELALWVRIAGPGGDLAALQPDVGAAVYSTAGIIDVFSQPTCGSSVFTSNGGGNLFQLNVTDANRNTLIGLGAGNLTLTGTDNTGLGYHTFLNITSGIQNCAVGGATLSALTSGTRNTAVGEVSMLGVVTGEDNSCFGYQSGSSITSANDNTLIGRAAGLEITTGSQNTACGSEALIASQSTGLTTGSNNIAIGFTAGSAYLSSESSNILIGNSGILGESGNIRIGTQGSGAGQQNNCFVAGIFNNTLVSGQQVIVNSNGQLGVGPGSSVSFWTVVTAASANMAVDTGYIANNAGTCVLTLPTTAAVGNVIRVTGINNATGWQIAQNAGQTIHFGTVNTTAGAGGSLTSSATRDSVELVCVVANTDWNVLSSVGNITVV